MERVGRDGVITVEEGSTLATELEVTEGLQFDKGFISPNFVTDAGVAGGGAGGPVHPDHHPEDLRDRGAAAAAGEGPPGQQAAADHRRGRRRPGAVHPGGQRDPQDHQGLRGQGPRLRRPPQGDAAGHGDRSPAASWSPPSSATSSTRSAWRCSAPPGASWSTRRTPRSSTVAASRAEVADRVAQIRKEIEASDSDWDREKLAERLAKLSGGIAVIKVGAATEVEMKERKHRIEDAIAATKAAVEEGTVPGGGAALAQIAVGARRRPRPHRRRGDRRLDRAQGARSSRCAGSPRTPATTATSWWARSPSSEWGHGLDAATGEYVDLAKAGIVDPVKVTRNAVANAASIAGLLLTTESLVVEKPAKRRSRPPAAATATATATSTARASDPTARPSVRGRTVRSPPCVCALTRSVGRAYRAVTLVGDRAWSGRRHRLAPMSRHAKTVRRAGRGRRRRGGARGRRAGRGPDRPAVRARWSRSAGSSSTRCPSRSRSSPSTSSAPYDKIALQVGTACCCRLRGAGRRAGRPPAGVGLAGIGVFGVHRRGRRGDPGRRGRRSALPALVGGGCGALVLGVAGCSR